MNNQSKIYVTREGANQYFQALHDAKDKLLKIKGTRSEYGFNTMDDPSTGVYVSEVSFFANRVREIEDVISRMVIVEKENEQEGVVGFGDIITILFVEENEVEQRQLMLTGGMPVIGSDEDSIDRITINSPMGKALYKKKVGDSGSFKVGQNEKYFTILEKESSVQKEEQSNNPKEKSEE